MTSMYMAWEGFGHLLSVTGYSVIFEKYTRQRDLMDTLARLHPAEVVFLGQNEPPSALVDFARTLDCRIEVVSVILSALEEFLESLTEPAHHRVFMELDLSGLPMPNPFYYLAIWYLQNRSDVQSEDDLIPVIKQFVSRVQVVPLQVTPNALSELGIFTVVVHPGLIQEANNDKMGMNFCTIFGQFCSNPIGRRKVKDILEHPTSSLACIDRRLEDLGVLIRAEFNQIDGLEKLTKKYLCFGKFFAKMIEERFEIDDFYSFHNNLCTLKELFGVASQLLNNDLVNRHLAGFSGFIDTIKREIDSKIDVVTKTGIIPGVCEYYDELEKLYGSMNEYLAELEQQIMKKMPLNNVEIRVICFPEIGYLISVSLEDPDVSNLPNGRKKQDEEKSHRKIDQILSNSVGDILGSNLEFVFRKDQVLFYRSDKTKELDAGVGDVRAEFWKVQRMLCLTIQTELLEYKDFLNYCDEKIAWTCGIVGISKACAFYDLRRPLLSNSSNFHCLAAEEAWNIFLKLTSSSCITFDFCNLDNEALAPLHGMDSEGLLASNRTNRINVVSGPNSSGKTVACKTIASLVYLAHCGLWVPATRLVSQTFERLFFFGAEPTSGSHLISSVYSSLQSFLALLPDMNGKAFIVFDEFVRNASSQNYEAFCLTVIQYFTETVSVSVPPLLFLNTHHLSLLRSGMIREGLWVSLLRMECTAVVEGVKFNTFGDGERIIRALRKAIEAGSDLKNTQLVNFYRFERGSVDSSFGYFLLTKPEFKNRAFLASFLASTDSSSYSDSRMKQMLFWRHKSASLLQFLEAFL